MTTVFSAIKYVSSFKQRADMQRKAFNYQSREWKRFQGECLEARHHQCEHPGCGTHRHVHAHHKIPISLAPHLAFTSSNIELLCPVHHAMYHGWQFIPTHWYTEQAANDDQFELDLQVSS